jgi:DNA-binding transcriptional regulator YhcF (GntR family)
MNRIWISRDSSIPIREQLSAQILFGIVSRRFIPSERLPSVRDLARRLKVHPNTVSAVYQDLAARGWVKRKAGSGVFVSDISELDAFVHAWMEEARSRGFSLDAVRAAFEKAGNASRQPPDSRKMLVLHPDLQLARILAAEIEESVGHPVKHSGIEDAAHFPDFEAHTLLTTTSGVEAVSRLRRDGHELIALKSMEELLAGLGRPASPMLIGIVSRSETILKWASLLIPALGLAGSDLIQRNPEHPKWREGLAACDLIAADVVCAKELPKKSKTIILRLVSDDFLERNRQRVTVEKV